MTTITRRPSPDHAHTAHWRWGGEMWMSGPEWGYLAVDGRDEIQGATADLLWSDDSRLLAFVKLHIEDVPNRQGAEGMSFRIGLMRMSDYTVRYCLGNRGLSAIKLKSLTAETVTVSIDGELKSVSLRSIDWGTS